MAPPTPPAEPTRELAAIMFSDVVGYTAIMGRDERKGLEAVARHREHLHAILPRFHGRLVGEIGDGSLSSFHSVVDALACARELQRELQDDPELRLRIGIHIGDVVHSGDTVLGDGVNIAARIHALAAPGGICVSATVYDEIRNKPGMRAKDLGEQQLKNVSRPIRIYALTEDAEARDVALAGGGRRLTAIAGGVVLVAALTYGVVRWRMAAPEHDAPVREQASIVHSLAVLPLDNFSGDGGQDYFADGMTDELTTQLAMISQLRVISRGSAMRFKGRDRPPTQEIARTLHVDTLVEGSVVRSGDRVRITAQLIDATTDQHLWAKSFDGDSRDVLGLQAQLAAAIAHEISVKLTPQEAARLSNAPVLDPAAHDAYLKGRYFFYRPSDENLRKAIAAFEEAIRLAPEFAPAYSGLADTYAWAGFNEGAITAAEAMVKMKAAAEKAVQLDDTLAEAHNSLGQLKFFFEYDWPGSEKEFRRALALNASSADAHDQYGVILAYQGRLDEALAESNRAVELNPLAPEMMSNLATVLAYRGDLDGAIAQCSRAAELDPSLFLAPFTAGWAYVQARRFSDAVPQLQRAATLEAPTFVEGWLAYAYGASGDRTRAAAILERWTNPSRGANVPAMALVPMYLGVGDRERALDALERGYAGHSPLLTDIGMDRAFDSIRSEPRFIALAKKVGFGG
jgi:class 3 adenylate cyclase/TolB-like protein/Flp pilus assembly protein TadD